MQTGIHRPLPLLLTERLDLKNSLAVIVSRARCALAVYNHTRVVSCGSSVDTFTPPHTL